MKKRIAMLLLLSLLLTGCSEVEPSSESIHHSIPLSELMAEASAQTSSPSSSVSQTASEDPSSETEEISSSETSSETAPETSSEVSSEVSSAVSSETNSEVTSKPSASSGELSANEGNIVLKPPAVPFDEPESGEWNLVLVNALHPIADDYALNLVNYNEHYQVDARIMPALKAMMQAAKQDGISVFPCSAYRTKERSAYLYDRQVQKYLDRGYSEKEAKVIASHWVAPPGTSEHHTGLALDFLSIESTSMDESFADTKAAKWLLENAESYGFILRYPKGKEHITGIVFEPWHYRYVGVELAAEIMQNDLTLEEYLNAEFVGFEEIEE